MSAEGFILRAYDIQSFHFSSQSSRTIVARDSWLHAYASKGDWHDVFWLLSEHILLTVCQCVCPLRLRRRINLRGSSNRSQPMSNGEKDNAQNLLRLHYIVPPRRIAAQRG